MLVLDLDGTTLAAGGRLLPEDVAAARALRAHGVHVTIATGRLYPGTRWVAEALGVEGAVAVMNGSELIDVASSTVRHGCYVERVARARAREVLVEHGLSAFLFGSRRIHLAHADERYAPYLGTWTPDLAACADVFAVPEWEEAEDVVAVCAAGDAESVAAACDALRVDLPPELGLVVFGTHTGEHFLTLRHHVEDKGTALGRLAAERSCVAAECVAVGDWDNDLPMLSVAGRAFAMGHASEGVKEAAGEVLDADRTTGGAVAEVARRVWGVTA